MEYKKYQHIERFGNEEVDGINLGECYVFTKLDGSNGQIWFEDGNMKYGSRNRELSLDNDNAGFMAWAIEQKQYSDYLEKYPNHRLFGEWLVPHSIKGYLESAWRRFYVFDVMEGDQYLHYEDYRLKLEEFGIEYVPAFRKLTNGEYSHFVEFIKDATYLLQDGEYKPEGIVIKNYEFRNKYDRHVWAKIVSNEFKAVHAKAMGVTEVASRKLVEEEISKEFITSHLVEKEYEKIKLNGWSSKNIPQLLNTIFYTVIKEEIWEMLKKHKNPKIDFKMLQHFVFARIKELKPELF